MVRRRHDPVLRQAHPNRRRAARRSTNLFQLTRNADGTTGAPLPITRGTAPKQGEALSPDDRRRAYTTWIIDMKTRAAQLAAKGELAS